MNTEREKILYVSLIEDPINNGIFNSQVINTLKQLAKAGHKVTLFSAPSKKLFLRHTEKEIIEFQLKLNTLGIKIIFIPIPIISNSSIRIILTPFLLLFTLPTLLYFSLKEKITIIHCRSYPAGLIGILTKILTSKKYIFDMRGIYPEESAFLFPNWHKKSLNFKFWKWIEKKIILNANHVIVVSDRFNQYILNEYKNHSKNIKNKISTIICGIDQEKYINEHAVRTAPHNPIRLVYSGTLDGWTSPELLAKTYRKIIDCNDQSFFLNIYTTSSHDPIRHALESAGIKVDKYSILRFKADEVSSKLRENDIGILIREQSLVNEVSFPVKIGEYLTAGLPIIINSALIGAGEFILRHNVGIVLDKSHSITKLTTTSRYPDSIKEALRELSKTSQSYVELYEKLSRDKGIKN